jgi:hypothetical protein
MARTVRLHRPQSDPAPHAAATSFDVEAPLEMHSLTTWLVAPVQRQTNMCRTRQCLLSIDMRWANLPTNCVG